MIQPNQTHYGYAVFYQTNHQEMFKARKHKDSGEEAKFANLVLYLYMREELSVS